MIPSVQGRRGRIAAIIVAKGTVSIVLLALVAGLVDWETFLEKLFGLSGGVLSACTIAFVVQIFVLSQRWRLSLAAVRYRLPPRATLRHAAGMVLFNQLLPASVGADLSRLALATRDGVPIRWGAAALVVDRVSAMLGLLAIVVLTLPGLWAPLQAGSPLARSLATVVAAAALCAVGAVVALARWEALPRPLAATRIGAGCDALWRASRRIWANRESATRFLAVACLGHGLTLAAGLGVASSAGTISIYEALATMAPVLFIAGLPLSIGGWGVRELSMATAFEAVGYTAELGLLVGGALGVMQLAQGLVGGLMLLALPGGSRATHEPL